MENMDFYSQILENIRKLQRDRNLTQATMADAIDVTPSQMSKMLRGNVSFSIEHISKLAHSMSMSEIDLFTYPEKYVKLSPGESEPVEAILQIKLKKDKKDQVLKLVFGENDIEILNK